MYEKYVALVNAIMGEEDELVWELLVDNMRAFPEYVNQVYNEAAMVPIIRFRYEGEVLRSSIEALDRNRRMAHNAAINSCNIINRMCDKYGVDRFCIDAEKADRYAVGDFCAKIVRELFAFGTKKDGGIDELIGEMKSPIEADNT